MRTLTRTFLALAASTPIIALAAGSASAGGPTSVIVVNPQLQTTGSLYATDDDYEILRRALDSAGSSADVEPPSMGEGPGSPSTLNMTWLIHDVSVWRVDRVNIDDAGTVWVRTYDTFASGSGNLDWKSEPDWHMAADPAAVLDVLGRMGVLDRPEVREQPTDNHAAGSSGGAAPPGASSGADSEATGDWWWVVPAAALGVVIGLVGRPHLASIVRRRGESGPRQQLIDA